MPYMIICMLAIGCLFYNYNNELAANSYEKKLIILFALLFAFMITMANYSIWAVGGLKKIVLFTAILVGGIVVALNILVCVVNKRPSLPFDRGKATCSLKTFILPFLTIVSINVTLLFVCKYPGILSYDSIAQVTQILSGEYSNHNPYYHTLIIRLFMTIGWFLFGSINAAVATYLTFQIIFMATVFSFSVFTLSQIGAPKWSLLAVTAFFALMPYHIMFSITMWKDVMFGGMVLLCTLFLYRNTKSIGNKLFNTIGLELSAIGVCLLRSNGLFAFAATTLLFFIVYKGAHKRELTMMILAIVISLILSHPVLEAQGVTQPDLVHALSIPLQQTARDIIENEDFTEEQQELIDTLVDTNTIKKTYLPWISDPVKIAFIEKGNLQDNRIAFLKLYVSRLIKHPSTYIKAWIDQTRGYWNSGYQYWIWADKVENNEIGVYRNTRSNIANNTFNKYILCYVRVPALQLFLATGLFTWIMLFLLFVALISKDKAAIMITIPTLMVIASLLISTPVAFEFRYIYAAFCTVPIIGILTFQKKK